MRKRIISILMVIVFTFSLGTTVIAQDSEADSVLTLTMEVFKESLSNDFGIEFAQNYIISIGILDTIFSSFPMNRFGDTIFPNDFGGIYIDDNGNLHMLVVGSLNAAAFNLDSFTAIAAAQRSEGVNVRVVEFPYNKLLEVMNLLNDLISRNFDLLPAAGNVRVWSVDVSGNRIVVELEDASEEMIELFRSTVFDSLVLEFRQLSGIHAAFISDMYSRMTMEAYADVNETESYMDEYFLEIPLDFDEFAEYYADYSEEGIGERIFTAVTAGGRIGIRRNGVHIDYGSIGYGARMGVRNGFITAAHLGNVLRQNDRIYFHGWHVGTVQFSGDVSIAGVDAAFVTLNPGIGFRFTVPAPPSPIRVEVTNSITDVMGRVIHSVGGADPNQGGYRHRSGMVATPNISFITGRGHWLNNVATVDFRTQPGESGGIAYSIVNLNFIDPDPRVALLGITVGEAIHNNNWVSIISRHSEIRNALGAAIQWP